VVDKDAIDILLRVADVFADHSRTIYAQKVDMPFWAMPSAHTVLPANPDGWRNASDDLE
jgi:hypothetical protein